jgi:hypothetical protein
MAQSNVLAITGKKNAVHPRRVGRTAGQVKPESKRRGIGITLVQSSLFQSRFSRASLGEEFFAYFLKT